MDDDDATLVYITQFHGIKVYIVLQCYSVKKFEQLEWALWYFQKGFPENAVFNNSNDAYICANQLEAYNSTSKGIITNDMFNDMDFLIELNKKI
jgi:hypothetical protein